MEPSAKPPPSGLWIRWVAWVTLGETIGFAAPAVAGATTAGLDGTGPLPWLLGAGAVEGALLGAAQAHVLRGPLRELSRRSWIMATSAAAVIAYLVMLLPSTLDSLAVPVLALLLSVGVLVTLLSIGTAQWLVLRRHLRPAWPWIGWTALGWLAGLTVFLVLVTPLWQEGQPLWLTILIGVLAGLVMAATVAAVTGYGVLRLLRVGRAAAPNADRPTA